jgi:N utilization substance protein A
VGEGFLSYDDLSVIEPDDLMEMGGLSAEAVDQIVAEAERRAAMAEVAAADERRKQRELERIAKATADAEAADAAEAAAAALAAGMGEDGQAAAEAAAETSGESS